MSGVIADTLAAHRLLVLTDHVRCLNPDTWTFCGWRFDTNDANAASRAHAAHEAEVLKAAGVGDLRALLDDLRGLLANDRVDRTDLRALAARYAPSDPTPKEQP